MSGRFATPPQRAILIGLGAFVLLGLTDGAIGTVWPDLRDDFGRNDGSFGQVFAGLAVFDTQGEHWSTLQARARTP